MNEAARRNRNTGRLAELDPSIRGKVAAIIQDLEGHGYRPRIQDAYRSQHQQDIDLSRGVTTVRHSFHNIAGANGEPEALAVDLLDDNNPTAPSTDYLLTLASSARAHGLKTGIEWYKKGTPAATVRNNKAGIEQALATRNFGAPIRPGWDPTHVEPRDGFTVDAARRGARPFPAPPQRPSQPAAAPAPAPRAAAQQLRQPARPGTPPRLPIRSPY